MNKLMRFVKDESGATAIEYGLLAAGIGLLLIVVVPEIGGKLKGVFTKISVSLPAAT